MKEKTTLLSQKNISVVTTPQAPAGHFQMGKGINFS
jgi:hypothetical protein